MTNDELDAVIAAHNARTRGPRLCPGSRKLEGPDRCKCDVPLQRVFMQALQGGVPIVRYIVTIHWVGGAWWRSV